ncbi:MAG: hypothetical protein QOK41_490 [Sphingomonadales bacterium]|nr:hypothetical protein [Sphingomonadales bacterium]
MIAVQRIGHATYETPDLARQLDYYTQVIGPRPWHEDRPQRPKIWKREDGAMVWGVPPAPDYLRSRPPMPGH